MKAKTDKTLNASSHTWLWVVLLTLVISGCLSRLYFGVIVRDQAELVTLSQSWSLLYDEQVPVLSWIMTGLFRLTDYFILWPDIYRYICLAVCLFSISRLTFHITRDKNLAVVAALSLFFLPTMHEEMLGELTHTAALLTATALSTDWMVRRAPAQLLKNKSLLILIAIWSLGFLAKHTMSFIIIAQVTAYVIAFRPHKAGTLRLALAALFPFILISPFYLIMLGQVDTFSQGLDEFYRDEGFTRGLVDLLSSVVTEAALFIVLGLVGFIIFWRRRKQAVNPIQTPEGRFLVLTLLFSILLFVPFIIVADIAVVRDRWLTPSLLLLGPIFAILISNLTPTRHKYMRTLFVVLVCFLGIFRASEPFIDKLTGERDISNAPIPLMSKTLRENHPNVGTYISYSHNLVATLKIQDPKLQVYTPKTARHFKPDAASSGDVIILSLKMYPHLKRDDLNLKCGPMESDTIDGWTYFYEVCKV